MLYSTRTYPKYFGSRALIVTRISSADVSNTHSGAHLGICPYSGMNSGTKKTLFGYHLGFSRASFTNKHGYHSGITGRRAVGFSLACPNSNKKPGMRTMNSKEVYSTLSLLITVILSLQYHLQYQ